MTPKCAAFIKTLREQLGVEPPACPVCTGHLDQDSGECEDCGQNFERIAAHFADIRRPASS